MTKKQTELWDTVWNYSVVTLDALKELILQ